MLIAKNQITILVESAFTPDEMDAKVLNDEILKLKDKITNTEHKSEIHELKEDLKILENNLKVSLKK